LPRPRARRHAVARSEHDRLKAGAAMTAGGPAANHVSRSSGKPSLDFGIRDGGTSV